MNLFGSLLVNGHYCGFTKAPYALWECDATSAIRPGEVNEICVVIKDSYYAVSPKLAGSPTRNSFGVPLDMLGQSWMMAHFDYPIGSGVAGGVVQLSGILATPSLVVAGPVYSSDVFANPSVKKNTLGLEITVSNPACAGAEGANSQRDRPGHPRIPPRRQGPNGDFGAHAPTRGMGAGQGGREGLRARGGHGRSGQGGGRQAFRAVGQSEALVAR